MINIHVTMKRLCLYIVGLFLLSLGVSFSIQANLGVSPVSSLAYAFSLTSGMSVGFMTVVANILFITLQVIFSKRFNLRESIVQFIVTVLFGFFMDANLFVLRLLLTPETFIMRWAFLIVSLFVVAIGLVGYFSAKFPLMPYDELTHVISERFNMKFSKAKVSSDLINVGVAGLVCIIFIQSLGSIGVGTLVAAYFIGKIVGWLMKHYQKYIDQWINKSTTPLQKET